MKLRETLTVFTNLVVVAAIAVYFVYGFRGPSQNDEAASRNLMVPTREEWDGLSEGAAVLGSGPITLVEFIDYQCPYCVASSGPVDGYLSRMDQAMVVRHFPLEMHRAADGAARAAICAEGQGRFPAMHRRLLSDEAWHDLQDWGRLASEVGLDVDAFLLCLNSETTDKRLEEDYAMGLELGVRATPTFFSPHGRHEGGADRWVLADLASGER